jgi:4'-phosphopantetheinyl transferase
MQLAEGWEPPPRELMLPDDEAHLWLIAIQDTLGLVPELRGELTDEERERADRFHFARDRERYTITRGALRRLLRQYLGTPEFVLGRNAYDKPLLNAPHEWLQFNVAHSGDLALLGFTRNRLIGVDVEWMNREVAKSDVAQRFFAPDEAALVIALPEPQRRQGFFNCWTRKEAYIKGRGVGLSLPLSSFSVTLTPGEPARLLRSDDDSSSTRWILHDLKVANDYAAAAAIERPDCKLKRWRWGTNPS